MVDKGLRLFQEILGISLIGGLINLDDVPVFQMMISQPIAAAPLIGWIWGDLQFGLVIGAFLELLMINQLPIGASVPLDASLASIVATGMCLLLAPFFHSRKALIALAILLSLPISIFARKASILVRKLNGKFSNRAQQAVLKGNLRKINLLHFSGIGFFYLRSFGLCFLSLLLIVPLLRKAAPLFGQGILHGLELLYTIYLMMGIALVLDTFRNKALYGLFILSFLSTICFFTIWSFPAWTAFGISCILCGTIYGAIKMFSQKRRT